MTLFEYQTMLAYPIDAVFALTVDLEQAPRWHSIFTDVRRLTSGPIGAGSGWKMIFTGGSFDLEIIDYQPPHRMVLKGSPVMRMVPNFTIEMDPIAEGTRIRYRLHPDIPILLKPLMAIAAPPYGRRDLNRYFRELGIMLAA